MANAKDLIKKMATDKGFRDSLEAAGSKDDRHAILAKNGFGSVTTEDVRAVAKAEGTELTDEQLGSVAGGMARKAGKTNVTRPIEWATVIVAAAALL